MMLTLPPVEYITAKTCDDRSDMYSLGQLIYATYNRGTVLFESHNNILNYQQNIDKVSRLQPAQIANVPNDLKSVVISQRGREGDSLLYYLSCLA